MKTETGNSAISDLLILSFVPLSNIYFESNGRKTALAEDYTYIHNIHTQVSYSVLSEAVPEEINL